MTSTMDPKKMVAYCRIPAAELENNPDLRCSVKILPTADDVQKATGRIMIDELLANKAAGRPTRWALDYNPKFNYNEFITYVNQNKIKLDDVFIFQMGDYLDWNCRPYPEDDPFFNIRAKFKKSFYDKIDPDLNVPECQRFAPLYNDQDAMDIAVEKLGGLDTVFTGIGYKGEVACCEAPADPYFSVFIDDYCNMKTRIAPVNEETMMEHAQQFFGGITQVHPPLAVTFGFKSMLTAKRVVFSVTTGSWTRTALRVLLFNEPTVEYPATLFPGRCPVSVLCDENSAKQPLPERFKPEFYNFQISGDLF